MCSVDSEQIAEIIEIILVSYLILLKLGGRRGGGQGKATQMRRLI